MSSIANPCFPVAYVGRNVILTSGCIIGACCNLNTFEVIPENTVIYGADCLRRVQTERPQVTRTSSPRGSGAAAWPSRSATNVRVLGFTSCFWLPANVCIGSWQVMSGSGVPASPVRDPGWFPDPGHYRHLGSKPAYWTLCLHFCLFLPFSLSPSFLPLK